MTATSSFHFTPSVALPRAPAGFFVETAAAGVRTNDGPVTRAPKVVLGRDGKVMLTSDVLEGETLFVDPCTLIYSSFDFSRGGALRPPDAVTLSWLIENTPTAVAAKLLQLPSSDAVHPLRRWSIGFDGLRRLLQARSAQRIGADSAAFVTASQRLLCVSIVRSPSPLWTGIFPGTSAFAADTRDTAAAFWSTVNRGDATTVTGIATALVRAMDRVLVGQPEATSLGGRSGSVAATVTGAEMGLELPERCAAMCVALQRGKWLLATTTAESGPTAATRDGAVSAPTTHDTPVSVFGYFPHASRVMTRVAILDAANCELTVQMDSGDEGSLSVRCTALQALPAGTELRLFEPRGGLLRTPRRTSSPVTLTGGAANSVLSDVHDLLVAECTPAAVGALDRVRGALERLRGAQPATA